MPKKKPETLEEILGVIKKNTKIDLTLNYGVERSHIGKEYGVVYYQDSEKSRYEPLNLVGNFMGYFPKSNKIHILDADKNTHVIPIAYLNSFSAGDYSYGF